MSLARTVQPNMKTIRGKQRGLATASVDSSWAGAVPQATPKTGAQAGSNNLLANLEVGPCQPTPLAVPYHPQQLTDNTIGLDKLRPGPKPRPGLIGKRSKLGRRPRRGLWLIRGSAPRPCIGAAPCWFGVGSRLAQQPLGKLLGNGFEATWPSTWAFYFCLIR